ncbi:hypothetical protein EV359DRAFT_87888 [Lentinula novae-zelandiae]|nr:hypothetical protein EV359DRAFT_87888 [Lentinula novae-zelandiae]
MTMEEHKKRMRNLLKKVHDLGGTMTNAQFRRIIISLMPPGWRQDVRSVPGTLSADAFTYLHTLWYEKEEERKEEERDSKRVKALMAAHSNNPAAPSQTHVGSRPPITCHNCSKPGHIARKCWAKGGGMEGQGPKQGATTANTTNPDDTDIATPMATYVMSTQANHEPSMSKYAQPLKPTTDPETRQNHPILREGTGT